MKKRTKPGERLCKVKPRAEMSEKYRQHLHQEGKEHLKSSIPKIEHDIRQLQLTRSDFSIKGDRGDDSIRESVYEIDERIAYLKNTKNEFEAKLLGYLLEELGKEAKGYAPDEVVRRYNELRNERPTQIDVCRLIAREHLREAKADPYRTNVLPEKEAIAIYKKGSFSQQDVERIAKRLKRRIHRATR
jgi:hypothetical protein